MKRLIALVLLLFATSLLAGNVQSLRTDSDGNLNIKVRGEDDVTIGLATETSRGMIQSGIQSSPPQQSASAQFKNDVKGSGNAISMSAPNVPGETNLVAITFSYHYVNGNGTIMQTLPTLFIYDTDGVTVLASRGSSHSVPTPFAGEVQSSLITIVPKPTGNNYVVKCYEVNVGGGVYTATNGSCSYTVSKIVF